MAEYRAIRNALPGDNVRINSTKSMIGHLLGAAGAVEAVAVIQAMQTGQHFFSCPFLSLLHLFCSSLLVLRFVFSVFSSARLLFSSLPFDSLIDGAKGKGAACDAGPFGQTCCYCALEFNP